MFAEWKQHMFMCAGSPQMPLSNQIMEYRGPGIQMVAEQRTDSVG